MVLPGVILRSARTSDAGELTAVAHAAKRYWNYPESWIDAWKEALTVRPEDLSVWSVVVAEREGGIAGFGAVNLERAPAELEHLWVRPDLVRHGIGRALFQACVARVTAAARETLETDADPNALDFYVKLGGRHVGDVPADVLGEPRTLRRVRFTLTDAPSPARRAHHGGVDVFAS